MKKINLFISKLLIVILLTGTLSDSHLTIFADTVYNPYEAHIHDYDNDKEPLEFETSTDEDPEMQDDNFLAEDSEVEPPIDVESEEEEPETETLEQDNIETPDIHDLLTEDSEAEPLADEFEDMEIPQELLDIMESGAFYNYLSNEQRDKFFRYCHVRQDVMEELQNKGYSVKESIKPAWIMQKLNIDFSSLEQMIEMHGSIENASIEASLFVSYLFKYISIVSNYEQELIDLVAAGYKTDEVYRAFVVARVLDLPVCQVIKPLDGININEDFAFSDEDNEIISRLINNYYINIESFLEYTAQNDKSIEEVWVLVCKFRIRNKMFVNDNNKSLIDSVDNRSGQSAYAEDSEKVEYPSAAYNFSREKTETINLNTGAMLFKDSIISIPGVNGLDLNLELQYNSRDSVGKKPEGRHDQYYACACERTMADDDRWYKCIYCNTWTEYHYGNWLNFFRNYYFQRNPLIQTGVGWALNTDKITDGFLQLANGGSYELILKPGKEIELKDYKLKDLVMERDDYSEYPGARYKLMKKDGTVEYFNASGNILAIIDRFNNKITYSYTNYILTITDTRNNVITVNNSESGLVITLPDKSKIEYKYTVIDGCHYLTQKIDQLKNSTWFYYPETPQLASFTCNEHKATLEPIYADYRNLYKVIYPTGLTTYYEYEKTNARFGIGRIEYFRMTKRYDLVNYTENDTISYNYSNEYSNGYSYYTGVSYLNGKYFNYTFNSDHLITNIVGVNDIIKYVYNDKKLPDEVTRSLKGSDSLTLTQKYTYDDYGNVLTHNNGLDTIMYTYYTGDGEYNLPRTKEYKKDSGTRIKEVNTPTNGHKGIAKSEVFVQDTLQSRTDFEYYPNGMPKNIYAYKDSGIDSDSKIMTSYSYNNKILLESKTIGDVTEKYVYDDIGNLLTMTDGEGHSTNFEYDLLGRKTKTINPDETKITNVYDDKNNVITTTNENGALSIYTYDQLGNLRIIETKETADKPAKLKMSYDYDRSMRLITETNPSGTSTKYTYDNLDRILTKKVVSANNEELYKETYLYQDGFDSTTSKVTKTIDGETNAPTLVTAEYTDKYGNLVKQSRMNGTTEISDTFTYDYLGNRKQATNALNQTTKYEYDYVGRVMKVTNTDNTIFQTAYDWLGRKTSVTDPKNSVSKYTYNDMSQLTKEEIPFEGSYYTTKTYVYDKNGNVTSQNISNNKPGSTVSSNRTDYEYNNRNWLTKTISFDKNAMENYTEYKYDNVGNKVEMITANGAQSSKYEYDNLNQMTKLTDALNQLETYLYDKNGNLISKTDRNGNVTTNTYDALNRLTEVYVTTPSGKAKEFIKFDYAKTGAKIREENENLITTFAYDSLGRLINQTESNDIEKQYGYDNGNNRTSFELTQNGSTKTNQTYEYDKMNRLTKTYDSGALSATYTYDLNGNRETLVYPNGITTIYAYNKANLVTSLINKKGADTLSGFTYTYYLDGNQATKTDSTGRNTAYEYDDLGRLKNETEKLNNTLVFSKAYTYDKANNRKTMVVSGEENYTTSYDYDFNNRLKTETKVKDISTETAEYQYDNNGNQISKITYSVGNGTGSADVGIYVLGLHRPTPRENYTVELNEYDVFNRLVGVQNDEGTSVYAYKADGLRLSKDVNGAKTTHVWDGGYAQTPKMGGMVSAEIVMELDSNGNVVDRYTYGINRIKSENNGFYLYNAHGDVVQLTDVLGVVTKNYNYDAFGVEVGKDDTDNNPFRYCAEYFDNETDTIYLRARYYSPRLGRFMTQDPIGAGLNWYTYCRNNPIRFIDPSGLIDSSVDAYYYSLGYIRATESDSLVIYSKKNKDGNKEYVYVGGPSKDLVSFVADYEKFYNMPYRGLDSQNRTVGYGHVITKADGTKYDNGITEEDALVLLESDLQEANGYLLDFLNKNPTVLLNQNQFDALVSFTFNAGTNWIDNRNTADLRNLLIKGDLSAKSISGELMTWVHVNHVPSAGLYRRRNDEARMFNYGYYNRTYPTAPKGYI